MNIPPVQIPENVAVEMVLRNRLLATLICLVVLGGCSALPGMPDTEVSAFGPSVEQVRSLLQQDRVREALDEALYLTRRYPSGLTETLVGWAMWRNGQITEAEARFRRAATTDLVEAYVGLATVRASAGRWNEAMRLLSDVPGSSESDAQARPLSVSEAWLSGDLAGTQRHLEAWSRVETDTGLARAAAAMAAAVADLHGPPMQWGGAATVVDLEGRPGGGVIVPVRIGGAPGRLLLDLAARQSLISPELAEAGGLSVRPGDSVVATTPELTGSTSNRHQPSPQQAAIPELHVGAVTLSNSIVGVGRPPDGVDGILGFDLLSTVRWSLRLEGPVLALGPAGTSEDVHRMIGGSIPAAVAWLNIRLARQGLALQVFVFPLVAGERVAAGLDLGRTSTLDSGQANGRSASRARLQMGGWSSDVEWETSSLESWASAGGVAPGATLGHNLIGNWILHWFPEQGQIRFDQAATKTSPAGSARRAGVLR